ncbi:hypothetical protein PC110_g18351 [Phytophthora cactorum]|uniref:Uncharacterized protein n=1 Tax=Phytophthora cactorum TaxID=29920 RepID=A0A329RNH1_9STRA|nr:hypothetical protein PC110_g18351 [Phytophthora cactorum]
MVKTVGQRCVVLIPPEERSTAYKFQPKGRSGVFIGSDPQRKGYFVYVSGQGNRVIHSRSVVFLEPPSSKAAANDLESQENPMQVITNESEDDKIDESDESDNHLKLTKPEREPSYSRYSAQFNRSSSNTSQAAALNGTDALTQVRRSEQVANRSRGLVLSAAHVTLREVIREPLNLSEARASKEWLRWEKEIREEIEALRENDTFEVVESPPGAHVIGSTAVFRVKVGENGEVERLKACICAQGFTQEFLKDYFETYAPIAKLNSIRVFLALATQKGCAYARAMSPRRTSRQGSLNSSTSAALRIRAGQSFTCMATLYGPKQAGRERNVELNKFLIVFGLKPTREDPCVYIHPSDELMYSSTLMTFL